MPVSLVVVVVLGGLVALAVTGMSFLATEARNAMLPVEWHGGPVAEYPIRATTIRLERDGTAQVVNVPRGEDKTRTYDGRDFVCFYRSEPDLYSGPATWEWVSDWRVRLHFEDYSLTLRAGKSGYMLPDPDWESPRFTECTEGSVAWNFEQTSSTGR